MVILKFKQSSMQCKSSSNFSRASFRNFSRYFSGHFSKSSFSNLPWVSSQNSFRFFLQKFFLKGSKFSRDSSRNQFEFDSSINFSEFHYKIFQGFLKHSLKKFLQKIFQKSFQIFFRESLKDSDIYPYIFSRKFLSNSTTVLSIYFLIIVSEMSQGILLFGGMLQKFCSNFS